MVVLPPEQEDPVIPPPPELELELLLLELLELELELLELELELELDEPEFEYEQYLGLPTLLAGNSEPEQVIGPVRLA